MDATQAYNLLGWCVDTIKNSDIEWTSEKKEKALKKLNKNFETLKNVLIAHIERKLA